MKSKFFDQLYRIVLRIATPVFIFLTTVKARAQVNTQVSITGYYGTRQPETLVATTTAWIAAFFGLLTAIMAVIVGLLWYKNKKKPGVTRKVPIEALIIFIITGILFLVAFGVFFYLSRLTDQY